MTTKECAALLICCGALHDIAEKKYSPHTGEQIKEVQEKIEKIAVKYLPVEDKRNLK